MVPPTGSIRRAFRRMRDAAGQRAPRAGSTRRRLPSAAFRQVLLRPWRAGLLVGMGALVWVVVADATGWWRVLGVVLFLVAAGALLALWLGPALDDPELDDPDPDPEPAARTDAPRVPESPDVPPHAEPRPDETPDGASEAVPEPSLPGQRQPSSEQ